MEWSADCLVVGLNLAGSPMIPNAGSYAVISILLTSFTVFKMFSWEIASIIA